MYFLHFSLHRDNFQKHSQFFQNTELEKKLFQAKSFVEIGNNVQIILAWHIQIVFSASRILLENIAGCRYNMIYYANYSKKDSRDSYYNQNKMIYSVNF